MIKQLILLALTLTIISCNQTQEEVPEIPDPNPPIGYMTKSYNFELKAYEYIPSDAFSTKPTIIIATSSNQKGYHTSTGTIYKQ